MFNNVDIEAGSEKAIQLAQKNINRLVRWYNTLAVFKGVSYHSSAGDKYTYLVVKYPKNMNNGQLLDPDRDGNYLLNGYLVSYIPNYKNL